MGTVARAASRVLRIADKTFLTGQTVYWYGCGEWRWGPLEGVEQREHRTLLRVRGQRGVERLDPREVSA